MESKHQVIRPLDDKPDISWPPKSKVKQWLKTLVRLILPDPIIYRNCDVGEKIKPKDIGKGKGQ